LILRGYRIYGCGNFYFLEVIKPTEPSIEVMQNGIEHAERHIFDTYGEKFDFTGGMEGA
jgi:hypothetical protein